MAASFVPFHFFKKERYIYLPLWTDKHGHKEIKNNLLYTYSNHEWGAKLFFSFLQNILCTNRIKISNLRFSDAQQKKLISCPVQNFFLFFLNLSSKLEGWAVCAEEEYPGSYAAHIQKHCISHNPALFFLGAACLLVEAEWLTGWSRRGAVWLVELIPRRESEIAQDVNVYIHFVVVVFL